MEIDRRHVLLGSGVAALALAGCRQTGQENSLENVQGSEDAAKLAAIFSPHWNYGDPPWETYEKVVGTPIPFNGDWIAVLHLELIHSPSLRLVGRRAHFMRDKTKPNDADGVRERVARIINHMNANPVYTPAPAPEPVPEAPQAACSVPPTGDVNEANPCVLLPHNDIIGLKDFFFSQPHHVVIYIKNPDIAFSRRHPVWFGSELVTQRDASYSADPNLSFYGATIQNASIAGGSTRYVHMYNYFQTGQWHDANTPASNRGEIKHGDQLFYSLNINAVINSSDNPPIQIPLIIDPDTGNMGGGGGASRP